MANAQRSRKIVDIISSQSAKSVKMLALELGVSEMTIRRDLQHLREKGVINMLHGLAFRNEGTDHAYYDLQEQQWIMHNEKAAIGRVAAAMIEPLDSVFIDCGTTAASMAPNIPRGMDITVICSTLNVLLEMHKKDIEKIIFSGGYYHKSTQTFESPEALQMLGNIRASKMFVTSAGVSMELGLTCVHQYEIGLKRLGLNNAQKKILLVDSSKFGKVSSAFFGKLEQIDTVVTDSGIPDAWTRFLQDSGIELIIANTQEGALHNEQKRTLRQGGPYAAET